MLSLLMVRGSDPPDRPGGFGYKGSLAGYAAACSEEPKGGTSCSSAVLVRAGSVSFCHCASST